MVDFYSLFQEMQAMGVYDYVLPFLLVFAILFAILEKLKVFGEDKTNVNLVISLISGLILMSRPEVIMVINNFIPKVSLFVIVIMMFLVVAGMFGAKTGDWSGYALFVAFIVSIIAIIWALYPGDPSMLPNWFSPDSRDKAWIVLIVTIVLVISFLKGKQTQEENWVEKFAKGLK